MLAPNLSRPKLPVRLAPGIACCPPTQGSRSRLAPILLSAMAARDPRPDPHGRSRLPLAVDSLLSAPFGIDAAISEVVEAALGRTKEIFKCPGCVTSSLPALLQGGYLRSSTNSAC